MKLRNFLKKYLFIIILAVVLLAAAIFGLILRKTYTDVTAEENYLDNCLVAELPGGMCITACEKMKEALPSAPLIVRVCTMSELDNHFGTSQQRAIVLEVYAGNKLSPGDEVFLTYSSWGVFTNQKNQPPILQRGFVNVLSVGREYLVFLKDEDVKEYEKTPVYFLYDKVQESPIAPVFCYEDRENKIAPTNGDSTYVDYALVRDNEFFAADEEGLEAWKSLKAEMMNKYPKK